MWASYVRDQDSEPRRFLRGWRVRGGGLTGLGWVKGSVRLARVVFTVWGLGFRVQRSGLELVWFVV